MDEEHSFLSRVQSRSFAILLLNTRKWPTSPVSGIAEYVGLGSREVSGTQSLSHPGSIGVEYLLLSMKGDVVKQIQIPADDFSDL